MNPKVFYVNSLKLSKRFLGEEHFLTQRFNYCYAKTDLVMFKEVYTSDQSDTEQHKSSKNKLQNMLEGF